MCPEQEEPIEYIGVTHMDSLQQHDCGSPVTDYGRSRATSSSPFTQQQHRVVPNRWSAIKCEHSYVKHWIPPRSRRNIHEREWFGQANPDTGTVPQSELAVMYNGRKLTLHMVHRRNRFGENLLHQSVMEGDIKKIQAILILKPDVNRTDKTGWTALHEAVLRGHYQAALELIRSGASVNAAGHNRVTPLHCAVLCKHLQIAELLIKNGAKLRLMDKNGKTAFDISDDPALQKLILTSVQEKQNSSERSTRREPLRDSSLHSETAFNGAASSVSLASPQTSPLPSCWTGHDSRDDTDSDQTINYLSDSEDSEDWTCQATQDFINGPVSTAHKGDTN